LSQGLGPLPVLKTFWDKEPFYRRCGIQKKERVIVPRPGVGTSDGVSGSDVPVFPIMGSITEDHIQDFCSGWFIVSGQSWVEFSLVSSASLKISSSVSTLATRSRPNF